MDNPLSLIYLPTAIVLGALHALEPGHAKTLTAAYLIGVKGTRRDAVLLGTSVAATHSFVVVLLAVLALYIGRETFTDAAMYWLQMGSGLLVVCLGAWLLWRRWPRARAVHAHEHEHAHPHVGGHCHAQAALDEDAHACAHAAAMPDYVARGERPTLGQIVAFGAAGGMLPCPASVTVMLLALSSNEKGLGVLAVLAFSAGLAVALVGVGLLVVAGLGRLGRHTRMDWLSRRAPLISAGVVMLSGFAALVFAHPHG